MSVYKKLEMLLEIDPIPSKDEELKPLLSSVNKLMTLLKSFDNEDRGLDNKDRDLELLRAYLEEIVLRTFKLYPKHPQIVSDCITALRVVEPFTLKHYFEDTVSGQVARIVFEWYEVLATIEDAFINREKNK